MKKSPASNLSSSKGRLYCPHQIFSSLVASRTTNLSLAARAVCLPVLTTSGPIWVRFASPRNTLSSYKASMGKFQYTLCRLVSPRFSRP